MKQLLEVMLRRHSTRTGTQPPDTVPRPARIMLMAVFLVILLMAALSLLAAIGLQWKSAPMEREAIAPDVSQHLTHDRPGPELPVLGQAPPVAAITTTTALEHLPSAPTIGEPAYPPPVEQPADHDPSSLNHLMAIAVAEIVKEASGTKTAVGAGSGG